MMDFQAFSPFVVPLAVVLGLLVGSFLNVVIYRLPVMMEREWKHECAEFLGGEDTLANTDTTRFN